MSQSHQGSPKKSDPSYGRRNFLKQSFVSLGVTVQEYVKNRDAVTEKKEKAQPIRSDWLRPPGAVKEPIFLERCTSCGDCVAACPYGSIQVHEYDESPVIFPDSTPCYLCEDFPCIIACETEALVPVGKQSDVEMGIAVVAHGICTSSQGCNACVSQCPTEAIGMDFSSFRIKVDENQCVGCGICEHICKTVNDQIAMKVKPARIV